MTENKKEQKPPAASYSKAISELEEILNDLSERDVDVDALAEKVRRGLELVKFCQEKINTTEMQVQEIVDSIGTEAGDGTEDDVF